MDPDTWTTYHIISNRARALCYVRAQQQFRIQTELVVNRLKSVTLQHLKDAESLAQINEKVVLVELSTVSRKILMIFIKS